MLPPPTASSEWNADPKPILGILGIYKRGEGREGVPGREGAFFARGPGGGGGLFKNLSAWIPCV